jgi:hypothetical protein
MYDQNQGIAFLYKEHNTLISSLIIF